MTDDTTTSRPLDFIRERVRADVAAGKHGGSVVTRFPPEPNGYLHIGHAKAICLDFGVAEEHGGHCNLRFDDTNPTAEDTEYVEAIERDVHWLGFDWGGETLYASDYFDQLYEWAVELIRKGKAYVCSLSPEEARAYRGRWNEPGRESPDRNRSVEENLDLFERMKNGEFANGAHTLRAKIDMSSSNMNLRDPVLYRILHAEHHRTGSRWCIYPMYDWAHGQSDAIEGVTHSLCTLEFEDHRPLYDWFLDHIDGIHLPQQIEFARLNLTYALTSKRKLRRLIDEGLVDGWDDPRMPTLTALRRRGCPPEAIRDLCARVGLTKNDSVVDLSQLEFAIRNELNRTAPRVMGVLRPLKVVIENYPDDHEEELEAINNPEDASAGTRKVPFSKVLYIERDDFRRDPPRKFFRLAPGREVRLRYAYFITCTEAIEDEEGNVVELRCTYDPATRGGDAPDGRKVKATLHWVSAAHAIPAEVRLYDRLFNHPNPAGAPGEIDDHLNLGSLEVLNDCRLEPSLAGAEPGDRVQFERLGYFCVDPDSTPGAPVFNRTVTLRDTWAKIERAQKAAGKRWASVRPDTAANTRSALQHAGAALDRLRQTVNQYDAERIERLLAARLGLGELKQRLKRQRDKETAALHDLAQSRSELDELQRVGATEPRRELDFFQILNVHHAEEAHSNFLGWLLDPEGTHETGSSFLREFLTKTAKTAEERRMSGIALSRVQAADWSDTEVRREWKYIDILLLNDREKVVCAIENKVRAPEGIGQEGVSQLTRYRRLLEAEFPNHERHFVFLTPSGKESGIKDERRFWIPEGYAAIHQTLKDLLEQSDALEGSDALYALAQYETTLRRNIVTSESEVAKLARRIYLEHRTALELAFRHKPDYKAELGQMLKEAIAETDGWLLDWSTPAYVRFRPTSWDRFDSQRSGTGWPPSKTLILFEVNCGEDPLNSKLQLCLGSGETAPIREQVYARARQDPSVFKAGGRLQDYTHLLKPVDLLEEEDFGPAWDSGATAARLRDRLSRFFEEQFPAIDELINRCFENADSR